MMEVLDKNRVYWREYLIVLLLVANLIVWAIVQDRRPSDILKVYFLDVGQGDAIFIESPQGHRILVDGGKNRQIISDLGRVVPFGDKRIDVVVATHPDLDHIGGLPEVLSRYRVELILEPGVPSESAIYREFVERIDENEVAVLEARRGMVLDLGDGVKLVTLFPNQDVSKWNPNDASVVLKLIYGEHSFLLTGDATFRTENILLSLDSKVLDSSVLKVGHHGSQTSTSVTFAEAVSPLYAIISAGKDNSYGHPHQTVLEILENAGAITLSTAISGTIKFETDGKNLMLK